MYCKSNCSNYSCKYNILHYVVKKNNAFEKNIQYTQVMYSYCTSAVVCIAVKHIQSSKKYHISFFVAGGKYKGVLKHNYSSKVD